MSVVFNAAADRIYSTTSVPSYNSAYTSRFWFQSTGSAFEIVWALNDGSSNYDDVYIRDTSIVGMDTQAGYVDGSTLTRPNWYHVCAVRETTTSLKLYINGTLSATNTVNIAGRAASNRIEWGGFASFNYAPLSGAIAHPAVFTYAFNSTEVAADMTGLQPQSYTNCWGYWPLTGLSLADSSGSGNNLTSAGTLTEGADPTFGQPVTKRWQNIPFARIQRIGVN